MAIGASMNSQDDSNCKHHEHEHEHDLVMPGFRFHPTEEELVDFYLRRKVEGKRFIVELITCVDLYRYDPWELPGLAAIGEKEWYFYVPRDRKYRSGDRPNRVTTSGYWKATGADRMIKTETLRSVGLKKTLVFYSGKAPKGIRTSWIMHEYRLPQHDTERQQKAELSLCRVYKRAAVEDYRNRSRSFPAKSSSSSSSRVSQSQPPHVQREPTTNQSAEVIQASYGESSEQNNGKIIETSPSSSTDMGTFVALSHHNSSYSINPLGQIVTASPQVIDDLHKIVNNYSHQQRQPAVPSTNEDSSNNNLVAHSPGQQTPFLEINVLPASLPAAFSDRFWEWNCISDASKNYTGFSSN